MFTMYFESKSNSEQFLHGMSVRNMARLAVAMMALFFVFSMGVQYIETLQQFVTINHLKHLNMWQVTYFRNGLCL